MYFLDTNVCIALINIRPFHVREHFRLATLAGTQFAISSVVEYELLYGAYKSARLDENLKRLTAFFRANFQFVVFDRVDADHAGRIRSVLESAGKPIDAYDTMIAAQAVRHDSVIVTANVGEFSRVAGLRVEDWSQPKK